MSSFVVEVVVAVTQEQEQWLRDAFDGRYAEPLFPDETARAMLHALYVAAVTE